MQTSKDAENRQRYVKNYGCFGMIVSILLVLVSLCSMNVSPVAAETLNDTGYSRKQILKMGLQRFTDFYCSQPQHRKHPQESAANVYRTYKQPDNLQRIARLPSRRRRQLMPFYTSLENWEDTAWILSYAAYGGGTARISDEAVSLATLEEFMGQVVGCYKHTQHFGKSTSRSQKVTQGGSTVLMRFEKAFVENQSGRRDDFRRTLPLFRKQTSTLRKTLALQAPTVQRLVAKHLSRFAADLM